MSDAFQVVRDFEAALCKYTGAPYAVTTTSCTAALMLAVAWHLRIPSMPDGRPNPPRIREPIEIPKRTYVGVPMSVIHAGGRPTFRDETWIGAYQLAPLPVWDCARRFTSDMYRFIRGPDGVSGGTMQCVSFHSSKILADTQGGAILLDDPIADKWLRRARFDGRTEGVAPKDDDFMLGWHAYMSPDVAARLLWKLSVLPKHNEPLPWGPGTNSDYPDLSLTPIFR